MLIMFIKRAHIRGMLAVVISTFNYISAR